MDSQAITKIPINKQQDESGEKALYHSIIEQLKDKELSDSQKDNFVKKLDELFKSMNDQSKEFQLNSIL